MQVEIDCREGFERSSSDSVPRYPFSCTGKALGRHHVLPRRRLSLPVLPTCDETAPSEHGQGVTFDALDSRGARHYAFFLSQLDAYRGLDGRIKAPTLRARATSDGSCGNSDGVFSMDCTDDTATSTTGPLSSTNGDPFAHMEAERGLRMAFTQFHNNGTFAFGDSFAYLGDTLSFRTEHGVPLQDGVVPSRRRPRSCGVIKGDISSMHAPFSSPSAAAELQSPSSSSSSDDEDYALSFPCHATSDVWNDIQQPSGCALQLYPAGDATAACSTVGWVTPCVAASLTALSHPSVATVGTAPRCLCATTYNPLECYMLEGVDVAPAALRGSSSGGPAAWAARTLLLRQNMLLEYSSPAAAAAAAADAAPAGFAVLCGATITRWSPEVVCVAARASAVPPSPEDAAPPPETVFFVRGATAADADAWLGLLRAAAALSLGDMYEFDRSSDALEAARPALTESAGSHSTLGNGRFACVKKARRVRGARTPCALKIFDKTEFWRRVELGQERPDTLVRETAVHAALTAACNSAAASPVVRLLSAFETTDAFVLEMELMSRSTLFHELAHAGAMTEADAVPIVRCLLEAVDMCQQRGIAHRDIKLSNILCPMPPDAPVDELDGSSGGSAERSSGPPVKLADFGMAGAAGADGCLRGRCGTPGYVAPEILHAGPHEPYGPNVDTYSVGVVAYTLLCGYEPFYGQTDAELLAQNKAGEFEFHLSDWCEISLAAQDFVSALMEADPVKRLTAAQALRHPWLLARHQRGARRQQQQRRRSGADGFFGGSDTCSTTEEEELDDEQSWI